MDNHSRETSWQWKIVQYTVIWQLLTYLAIRSSHTMFLWSLVVIGLPFIASYYFTGYKIESFKIGALLFFPGTSVMMLIMYMLTEIFPAYIAGLAWYE